MTGGMSETPEPVIGGSRWRNPKLRGVWTVISVGPKYVTLKPSLPDVPVMKVDRVMWPGSWFRA
jgi:hypothetical protein